MTLPKAVLNFKELPKGLAPTKSGPKLKQQGGYSNIMDTGKSTTIIVRFHGRCWEWALNNHHAGE